MASNRLPREREQLFTLAEDMASGLGLHESAIGIKQNTEANVRTNLDSARISNNAYRNAVSSTKALTTAQTIADSKAKVFIAGAKRVLTNYLGSQWSPAWGTAGFINNSVAIPATVAERQTMLRTLTDYFKANPDHQNAQLEVTAAKAEEVFNEIKTARSQVNTANGMLGQTKAVLETAEDDLRRRMNGLLGELTQLLPVDDPLWYAFGLNRPSDPAIPGIPDNLVLTVGLNGTIHATWAPARRASRYRIYKKEAGDAEFVHAITVSESEATITGLSAGTVQIQVNAANEAGESQPGASAQIVARTENTVAVNIASA